MDLSGRNPLIAERSVINLVVINWHGNSFAINIVIQMLRLLMMSNVKCP